MNECHNKQTHKHTHTERNFLPPLWNLNRIQTVRLVSDAEEEE